MANEVLAEILRELAYLLELEGANPFKIRALENSARLLEDQDKEVEELIASGEIEKIQGVGKGTQAIAREFVKTGKVAEHEELKAKFPPGIFEPLSVSGLGPKKAKALYEQLQIASLTELEYACRENRLVELKGFGEKTQANFLQAIEYLKASRGKMILPAALQEGETLLETIRGWKETEQAELAGELRRHLEIVGSLEVVAAGGKDLGKKLEKEGFVQRGAHYEKKGEGLVARVTLASPAAFGSVLLQRTGPEQFVHQFGEISPAASEQELFQRAKKDFLPPECRDLGHAPKGLIEEKDIRGVFHLHTKWSDGANTLEEMVLAAQELGLEYLGVSEHSRSAVYAHGLDEKRVLEQKKEIEKLRKKFPDFRIFHGIESDILADGSLDYDTKFLTNFDFVIASVHGAMRQSKSDMTKRLVNAVKNPATTWLGHWTGRLLLGRAGYEFDHEEVMKAAAGEGKGIELNASPYRLDIDWRELGRAAELKIPVGIFPDAHSAGGLADFKYGVWMARKAGLKASDIVNTKPLVEMEKWLG